MRSYLTELDLSVAETRALLVRAAELKRRRAPSDALGGAHVALYFEKPSVRTRISFAVAAHELGAQIIELSPSNTKVGKGEHVEDFAKVVGRYVKLLVARVFAQSTLEAMARFSGVPVVNALSDERHPCQALADVLTIQERLGRIEGVRVGFVGEGNNVATSLGLLGAALGAEVRVASPPGYGLPGWALEQAKGMAGVLLQVERPEEAAAGAQALYTDTWISMGQEGETAERRRIFAGYKIDERLLAAAADDAFVLHCLPAVRGEEIDAEVMHGPRSAIWDQAENRLHVQKALLLELLRGVP